MEIHIIPFEELSLTELHSVYQLRSEVFVVEQNCAYLDVDDLDQKALHVLISDEKHLLAYARIIPPGIVYPEPAIGRVVVKKQERGRGLASQLMKYCITKTISLFPALDIRISAQAYLEGFYTNLGFKVEGTGYLEDGIPHLSMRFNHLNNNLKLESK